MTAEISVEILLESALWEAHPGLEIRARQAVDAALTTGECRFLPEAELSLAFSDDARVRELNRDWRDKDRPTNVLSFPAAEGEELAESPLLGDVILAYETVAREALDEDKPFLDHVAHLVVHGTLHLFGFDHMSDEEAEMMENVERAALARLGIPDPYRETPRA